MPKKFHLGLTLWFMVWGDLGEVGLLFFFIVRQGYTLCPSSQADTERLLSHSGREKYFADISAAPLIVL